MKIFFLPNLPPVTSVTLQRRKRPELHNSFSFLVLSFNQFEFDQLNFLFTQFLINSTFNKLDFRLTEFLVNLTFGQLAFRSSRLLINWTFDELKIRWVFRQPTETVFHQWEQINSCSSDFHWLGKHLEREEKILFQFSTSCFYAFTHWRFIHGLLVFI